MPRSADRITPGQMLIFRYNPQEGVPYRTVTGLFATNQKVVLVVACKKGDGVYPGLDGKLVSCFKLTEQEPEFVPMHQISEEVLEAIMTNLYKKRRKASYYTRIKESLTALLGEDSYRTYKLGKMVDLSKIDLST